MNGFAINQNNAPSLFTLEELEQCDTRPKKEQVLKYFENPKNDNEKLFNLQWEFITYNQESTYWQLWALTSEVAERIIKKILRKRGIEFAPDEIAEKVDLTCDYLLRRYKTTKGYFISTNFIIAIKDSVRHAIDYRTEIDKNTKFLNDDKNIDFLAKQDLHPEDKKSLEELLEESRKNVIKWLEVTGKKVDAEQLEALIELCKVNYIGVSGGNDDRQKQAD